MDNPQDRNNAPAAAGNLPPAQEPAHSLFSIWEDDMVEKFIDDKGKPKYSNGAIIHVAQEVFLFLHKVFW